MKKNVTFYFYSDDESVEPKKLFSVETDNPRSEIERYIDQTLYENEAKTLNEIFENTDGFISTADGEDDYGIMYNVELLESYIDTRLFRIVDYDYRNEVEMYAIEHEED